MPSVDELLSKNKARLEKISEPIARKKISRAGPTRPWQEHLPEYSTKELPQGVAPGKLEDELTQEVATEKPAPPVLNLDPVEAQIKNAKPESASPKSTFETPRTEVAPGKLSQTPVRRPSREPGQEATKKAAETSTNSPKIDDLASCPLPPEASSSFVNHQQIASKSLANHQQIASNSPANHQQIASEPLANRQQITSKPSLNTPLSLSNLESPANHQQIASEPLANRQQITSKSPAIENEENFNHQQITSKSLAKSPAKSPAESPANHQQNPRDLTVVFLQGIQRKLAEFLYSDCKEWGTRTTRPIPGSELALHINSDIKTAKNALDRLVEKKIIIRSKSFPGRLGSTIYEIPDDIFRECVELEKKKQFNRPAGEEITSKSPAESPAKSPAKSPASPSSSSSDLDSIKLTTETLPDQNDPLPEEWKEINFSCLASYRFTENHLVQIYQAGKATPEQVQESIYELHHDLTVNKNTTLRNPRNVLLSLLKKGSPYTSPGYESELQRAERRCLEEQKKREVHRVTLQQEHEILKNLPGQLEREQLFHEWLGQTTEAERRRIAPQAKTDGSEMQRGLLRSYWEESVAQAATEAGELGPDEVRRIADSQFGKFEVEE